MISYVTGSLFSVRGLDARAHGVNCEGVMGAGIARQFRERYPFMFGCYRSQCKVGNLRPGYYYAYREHGGPWIYNLATQDRPGPHATLDAIERSVLAMLRHAERNNVHRIGLPRIGCGIGGLDWHCEVRPLLESVAVGWSTDLIVVSLPGEAP